MNDNDYIVCVLAKYATEYHYKDWVIWKRYDFREDIYHKRHPHPKAPFESIYAISPYYFQGQKSDVYNKVTQEFIWLPRPSNRTDKLILETSFTLEEAWAIIQELERRS